MGPSVTGGVVCVVAKAGKARAFEVQALRTVLFFPVLGSIILTKLAVDSSPPSAIGRLCPFIKDLQTGSPYAA